MLEKIELFVARGLVEILAVIFLALGLNLSVGADDLVALLFAEWRIGQHHVVMADDLIERIGAHDRVFVARGAVQVHVHGAQPDDVGHDVDAGQIVARSQLGAAVANLFHPLPGGKKEAAGAAGRVMNGFAWLRIDDRGHRVDQRARRKVLSGTAFDFGGVAFKQPLVDRAFGVEIEAEPGFLADHGDEPAQLRRVLDFVLGLQEQAADQAIVAATTSPEFCSSVWRAPRPANP